MTETIIYSDIDLEFEQTSEGDIQTLENLDSIKQSIKIKAIKGSCKKILFTNK